MTFLNNRKPVHVMKHGQPNKARDYLTRPRSTLILDTETTGLSGEVIELAIINLEGEVLYNGRFNPSLIVESGAVKVHGITRSMLRNEPFFDQRCDVIRDILANGDTHLAYNAAFDVARLNFTCTLYGLDPLPMKPVCLMKMRGRKVKLGGGHSALSDCLKALELLKELGRE